jgi:hypothetical protein
VVIGEVDRRVGVVLRQLDQLMRPVAPVAGKLREQGRVTLGSQEVIRDAVSVTRGAMKCSGLIKFHTPTQSFLVITIRTANLCHVYRLKLSPFFQVQVQFATAASLCDIWYSNYMPFTRFSMALVFCQPPARILPLTFTPRSLHFRPRHLGGPPSLDEPITMLLSKHDALQKSSQQASQPNLSSKECRHFLLFPVLSPDLHFQSRATVL